MLEISLFVMLSNIFLIYFLNIINIFIFNIIFNTLSVRAQENNLGNTYNN